MLPGRALRLEVVRVEKKTQHPESANLALLSARVNPSHVTVPHLSFVGLSIHFFQKI